MASVLWVVAAMLIVIAEVAEASYISGQSPAMVLARDTGIYMLQSCFAGFVAGVLFHDRFGTLLRRK